MSLSCEFLGMFKCRFPFLLLDRVVEYEPQKYAVGYKNVTANDNFFTGHFPERKIMPGVNLLLVSERGLLLVW